VNDVEMRRIISITGWVYEEARRCEVDPAGALRRYDPVVSNTEVGITQADWIRAICKRVVTQYDWNVQVYARVPILTISPRFQRA
jgi:hypothetical protein